MAQSVEHSTPLEIEGIRIPSGFRQKGHEKSHFASCINVVFDAVKSCFGDFRDVLDSGCLFAKLLLEGLPCYENEGGICYCNIGFMNEYFRQ